jgi:hypothetical protein
MLSNTLLTNRALGSSFSDGGQSSSSAECEGVCHDPIVILPRFRKSNVH